MRKVERSQNAQGSERGAHEAGGRISLTLLVCMYAVFITLKCNRI